jgi:hypothetical protein
MSALVPIVSLLAVVALGLIVVRIGTVALKFTGLSHELARFQALSAFLGVGFTTQESEEVIEHPVRRRIIRVLMLLGNAGFVAAISSIIPVFVSANDHAGTFAGKMLVLASGLGIVWAISVSKWVDGQMSRGIGWALKRWTHLDVYDYHGLLQLGMGYSVSELKIEPSAWVAGRNLAELRLGDEGVQVLAIRRAAGDFIGAPTGRTYIRRGDTIILYGKVQQLAELDVRESGESGEAAHRQRVEEVRRANEESGQDLRSTRIKHEG